MECWFLWIDPRPTGIEGETESTCKHTPARMVFCADREEHLGWADETARTLHSELFRPHPKLDTVTALLRYHKWSTDQDIHSNTFLSPSHATPGEQPTSSKERSAALSYFPSVVCASESNSASWLVFIQPDQEIPGGRGGLCFPLSVVPRGDTLGLITDINMG